MAVDHNLALIHLIKQKHTNENQLVFSLILNDFRRRKIILDTSSNILENCIHIINEIIKGNGDSFPLMQLVWLRIKMLFINIILIKRIGKH